MSQRRLIMVGVGDSILEGRGDSPDATRGWLRRGCEANGMLLVNLGKGSERGSTQLDGQSIMQRLAWVPGASHQHNQMGTNDWRAANFGSLYLAVNALIAAGIYKSLGMLCSAGTTTPVSTSTDGWTSPGNQTPHGQNLWRQGYNRWLRAGAPCAHTKLTAATALTAANIALDDITHLEPTGILIIDGIPIFYTGKGAGVATGCSGGATAGIYAGVTGGPPTSVWPQPNPAVTFPAGTDVISPLGWVVTMAKPGQTLPLATIQGTTTAGFAGAGSALFGGVPVDYANINPTDFLGASGGSIAIGSAVVQQVTHGDDFSGIPAGAIHAGDAAHPLFSYWEVGTLAEVGLDTGIWQPGFTLDGVHPNDVGHDAMSLAVAGAVAAGKIPF